MVYLDYAANSPVDKEVLDVFYNTTLKYIANPNSSHKLGIEAKEILDKSTQNIAKTLGVKENEIIYTSGASESNNLAIRGLLNKYKNRGKHIITTTLEHTSVMGQFSKLQEEGYEVDILDVLHDGHVDLDHLKDLLRDDTVLVTVPYVDSEIGIEQEINKIGEIVKEHSNCFFFCDATQAVGKIKVDTKNVDLMTISPHKFYGLNGFGILIKKENIELEPIIIGGKSTTIYRSGTPVLGLVVATDKALEIATDNLNTRYEYVSRLNLILRDGLKKYKDIVINSTENSIPYTLNFSIKTINSVLLAKELENYEIYVSTKTACCPTNTISRSVYALTNDKKIALYTLRVSLSHLTTEKEIEDFLKYFDVCYNKLINN